MELAQPTLPKRAVIRCKAKQRLMMEMDGQWHSEFLDEELFNDLSHTLFQSPQFEKLRQPYGSKSERCAVEDWAAMELAIAYRRITQQRQDERVQNLNALLG
jgi:hypothetical protein